ncbi:MAG TPA: selenocysteine-specific translation elongation factor [Burkholderiales bacterium]|nr:selenocysteine-specific translation elongation factor [Burkholderiales bacterium]
MIVATAGHIDHGKTLLVRTLTGVDTDRLPEEKARGISIDLGFAYLPLPGGQVIGFVDVPGHERFIRNMLAGVCGIDFALLVVAADDGVMPQTVEHLHILDLLHVKRGAAVITKSDRVDAGRVREVEAQVQALLQPTQLADAKVLAVSAVTGAGMEALKAMLVAEATRAGRSAAAGEHFRYAVDRTFTVSGSGTVVTGTVFNGTVKTGDKLVVSPAGLEVRVRGIQIQGKSAERASAGERCALNLTGADLSSVHRGDWVLAPAIHKPTRRVDARVTVLASEEHALEHWTPVHLHLATSDVTARVATRRGTSVAPGASAVVQLVLDQPIGALRGDRFILRDQSATRTVGGGFVLDPYAPATRRSSAQRVAELEALEHDTPEQALAALLAATEKPIDLARLETTYNMTPERAAELYRATEIVQIGKDSRLGMTASRVKAIGDAVVSSLTAFHRSNPQAAGHEVEPLRAATAADLSADAYASILRKLADERKIETSGSIARLPGHNATANAADDRMWQTVRPALEAAAFNAPPIKDLAAQLKIKEPLLKDFLYRKAKTGEVMRVTTDRFYTKSTLATLAAVAQATAQAQPAGQFTAAQYRDFTGVGRSLAIEILEFLDTLGITQRIGDARKMRKDFVPILGAATAPPPPPKAAAPAKPPAARPAQPQRRPFNNYRR